MLGEFIGTPDEKLEQVAALFGDVAPQASCTLSDDGCLVTCQAKCPDGDLHVEALRTAYLPTEIVRHAAMRLGKATHPPESIGDWERWASAWHVLQVHGDGAIAHVENRIGQLEEDGAAAGVVVFRELRQRIAVLEAKPEAWGGRA